MSSDTLVNIGSDNDLYLVMRCVIAKTNIDYTSIGIIATDFIQTVIKIQPLHLTHSGHSVPLNWIFVIVFENGDFSLIK